jgi:hypothetical protein
MEIFVVLSGFWAAKNKANSKFTPSSFSGQALSEVEWANII